MIQIGLASAPCGSGKTWVATDYAINLVSAKIKLIICQPSLQLIDQTMADIRAKNPNVRVTSYHTGNHEGLVIPELTKHFREADEHGEILLMTHAALERLSYIENKSDWHLLYDEQPQIDWSYTFTLAENRQMLLDLITTMPAEENPAYLVLQSKDNGVVREFARNINDDMVQAIFREVATKLESAHSTVFALREQFDNFAAGNINQLTLAALISPTIFEGFGSVIVLAACLEDSNMVRYWKQQKLIDVNFYRANKLMNGLRYSTHPNGDTVDIFYMTDKNWTKHLRDKVITPDEKIQSFIQWSEFLAVEQILKSPTPDFVYMCNKDHGSDIFANEEIQNMMLGIKREQLPNTTHGLNQYQTYNNVVVFSALNPPPPHYKFLKEIAGLDPDEVKAAGYRQSAYQAVMRTSLRKIDNRDMKTVVVMDKSTANFLGALIPGARIQKISAIDLDIVVDTLPKKRRAKKWASEAERLKAYRQRKKVK